MLDLSEPDDGERPEVGLTGALKVAFVIELLDRLRCRIAVREVVRKRKFADAGVDGLLLYRRQSSAHVYFLSKVAGFRLFHFHDVVRLPGLVEERLCGAVQAQSDEVAALRNSRDPVSV